MSEPPWLDADEERAWRSLVIMWRLGFLRLERTFRRFGLIQLEYGVLAVLAESDEGTLTAGQLAELTDLSTSHLSHRLKNLCTKGLIERNPDPQDRRVVNVTITPDGRRLLDEVAPAHVADVRELIFDHLEPDEVRQLADLLGPVADRLGRFPDSSG